ncbi:MAG: SpoIIE family protein phosphatase [Chitinivibrionales bacterium]|nr:SpoIIE family protein phosphatase [Chitinivibrionales bacterium]
MARIPKNPAPSDPSLLQHELQAALRELAAARKTIAQQQKRIDKLSQVQSQDVQNKRLGLEHAYAEMNEELDMARTIQQGLMPGNLPESTSVKSAAIYMPAGKVGGDLYDVIITREQKVAVLIFDVSGHGVPAALIAAMAKMLFAHYIEKLDSPGAIFSEVNRRISTFVQSDYYLTAFLGILNPIENTMIFSKAGHVPPILYRSADGRIDFLRTRGFFIGHSALTDIAEYDEDTIQLEPGDKLLLYTDGLTEGSNLNNVLFGQSRLAEVVHTFGSSHLNAFLDHIIEEHTTFRNGCPLKDDFTLLAIEAGSSDVFLRESGFDRDGCPEILVLNSIEQIESISATILREMDRMGYPDKSIKRTKLCIFEALTNAIDHGNKSDPSKKALVFYTVTEFKTAISVVDEGYGFDYRHLPDPLDPENILKDHGRGLFIIRQYMDELHFNEKGNRIMILKYHERSA